MPDDWGGHPQRKDYPLGGEPVQFSDAGLTVTATHRNRVPGRARTCCSRSRRSSSRTRTTRDLLEINIGPNHPSTHGVLRLVTVLDGEDMVGLRPVIGYVHTGIEKNIEQKT